MKLLGLFLIVDFIIMIPSTGFGIKDYLKLRDFNPGHQPVLFIQILLISSLVFALISSILIAFIFLKWSENIAKKLIKEDSEIPTINSADWEKSVFHMALRVTGIVYIADALPLIINLFALWISNKLGNYSPSYGIFVRFGIGLYLALDSSHLVKLVFKEKKIAQ